MILMRGGKVVNEGDAADLARADAVAEAYFGKQNQEAAR
jgi:ABC-type branched-subunit amino acid transport system ATPase component